MATSGSVTLTHSIEVRGLIRLLSQLSPRATVTIRDTKTIVIWEPGSAKPAMVDIGEESLKFE